MACIVPTVDVFARSWCEHLAARLECRHILREGRPYLDRYFLSGWSPSHPGAGPSLFLHHFLDSDGTTEVHSHPWGYALSLILVGGYREIRCGPHGERLERIYTPGDINILTADVRHRIELVDGPCWSLFLADAYAQAWTFFEAC